MGLTLGCGQCFRWRLVDEGWFEVAHGVQFALVRQVGGPLDGHLEFVDDGSGQARHWLPRFLGLDEDYEEIYAKVVKNDPLLSHLLKARPGLRILHQDPWEALVQFTLSSCSNVPRITKNVADLALNHGSLVKTPWGEANALPTPRELEGIGEGEFRRLGFGYRAKFLANSVRILNADPDYLDRLLSVPLKECLDALQELPGVGPKVAHCVALFGLDHHDAFPADVWILRVVREHYARDFREAFPGRPLNARWVAEWARHRFEDAAGVAQEYLYVHARDSNSGTGK